MHQIEEYDEEVRGREGGGERKNSGGGNGRGGERGEGRGWLVFNGVEAAIELCVPFLSSLVGSGPTAPSPFSGELEEESCAAARPGVPSA